MKKLIAILVVLTVLAGTAFAEANVSGTIETRFYLFQGSSADDSELLTGGAVGSAYIQLQGQNDEGTFGGLWRVRNQDIVRSDPWFHRAFTWWKPIPEVRIFLGIDNDGKFSTGDALTDWQFHQGPEDFLAVHDWNYWRKIFPGHWDGFGLAFELWPVEGLNINITIPTGGVSWPQATSASIGEKPLVKDVYPGYLKLQMNYAIPDIGKIFFAYDAPRTNMGDIEDGTYGFFGLSFLLDGPVQGIKAQAGISADIPAGEAEFGPINIGLALHFNGDGMGVKFRSAFEVGGPGYTFVTANVMPWFALDKLTLYVDVGLALCTFEDSNADTGLGFWVTPYAKIPLGGGALEMGLLIYSNVETGNIGQEYGTNPKTTQGDDLPINFALPFRFVYSF